MTFARSFSSLQCREKSQYKETSIRSDQHTTRLKIWYDDIQEKVEMKSVPNIRDIYERAGVN